MPFFWYTLYIYLYLYIYKYIVLSIYTYIYKEMEKAKYLERSLILVSVEELNYVEDAHSTRFARKGEK